MKPALRIIARQFHELTGLALEERATHRLEDGTARRDHLMHDLADVLVNDAALAERLARACAQWQRQCDCETLRALAGYVAYCRAEYGKAANYFLAAISANPPNLDNWLDLGFALMHQDDPLGRHLIFNHDEYLRRYLACGDAHCTLRRMRELGRRIDAEGVGYREVWKRFVP